jgi:hypothetical protein
MGSLLGPPVMITFIISTRESKKILVSSKYSAISGLFAVTAGVAQPMHSHFPDN